MKEHWLFLNNICMDISDCTVIIPDYPLPPKYNYKDVFGMVEGLYSEIINNVDSEKLIVMGDSAGGGLSLALMQKVGIDNKKQPEKLILISPWLDIKMQNPKIDEVQKVDKILNKNNKDIIRKVAKVVYCKGYKVERIMINVLKI